jgi:putative transposase
MPNTYTQLYIHLIFAVKFRQSLIEKEWKDRLHKYMTGIFQNNGHKVIQINSMPDHLHVFIGFHPNQSLSSIVQNVKTESSKWVNSNKFLPGKFHWQEGFGAFTYSKSQLDNVANYIINQEEHHRKKTFRDEYREFLNSFGVDWNENYIFKEPE